MSLRDHRRTAAAKLWALRQAKVGGDPEHRGPWVERRTKQAGQRLRTSEPHTVSEGGTPEDAAYWERRTRLKPGGHE